MKSKQQFHHAVRPHGIYDVFKLWELTKHLQVINYPVENLLPMLEETFWENEDDKPFSPADLLYGRIKSPKHEESVMKADLNYPILLFDQREYAHVTGVNIYDEMKVKSEKDILDGLHRYLLAVLKGDKTIKAVIVPWVILQRAKIGDPNLAFYSQWKL